jgi:hypothetical protein
LCKIASLIRRSVISGLPPAAAGSARRFSFDEQAKEKRVKGIEPSCAAWEAAVLPLNYTREEKVDG